MSDLHEVDLHELGDVAKPARRIRLKVAPREGEYVNLGPCWYVVRAVVHGGSASLTIWFDTTLSPLFVLKGGPWGTEPA